MSETLTLSDLNALATIATKANLEDPLEQQLQQTLLKLINRRLLPLPDEHSK